MQDLRDDIAFAFKQGDLNAFDSIYDQFRRPIISFCKCMVPIEDAKEITADVFVRLWKTRDRWENIQNVRAFLYMSARNACFDFLKSKQSKLRSHEIITDVLDKEQEYILQSEIESDLIALIKQEIERLPDTCRTVFKMFYFEDLQNSEIAQKLNLSYQTVANLKSLALNTIKKNLKTKGLQLSTILLLIQVMRRMP
ncbi:MAG: RNA polymerase sigma-70 factor [Niastella sp.]|jgi:RNA polymerase sigma-70 factor (family 1)|uniref:RNA polymerase sigma-70 factor n=1 Tax=Niastella sp. TaxID=1869183 RepID=UPI00389B1007